MDIKSHSQARSKGGEGGRPLLQFLKIKESVLMLKRKALIVSITGSNFPFKGEKSPKYFPKGLLFFFLF